MTSPLIEVRSVTKAYRTEHGSVPALTDVSLGIGRGEFVALLGPSGCGKTSLLMIIGGLVLADEGEVRIGATTVRRPYTDLGMVFQTPELLEWRTSLQNVLLQAEIRRLPSREYLQRALDLLAQVGLRQFADRYPDELSGGMKQRVALCRALLHDPEILLLDEPFGALDALTRDQMNLDLQRLWLEKRKTAILVTHSIDEAVLLADRVVVMTPRPGSLAEELTIELPRPRGLEAKHGARFNEYTAYIENLFKRLGVFKDA